MNELNSLLSNWLYNVIQPQYASKQLTYTHLYQLLQVHYGRNLRLKVRTSVHTSSKSGQLRLLLNVFGDIPISLSQLVVPIQIWIPFSYPYGSGSRHNNILDSDDTGVPMIYVIPDRDRGLSLKPGNHVDSLGRFYHPFLTNWFHECQPNTPGARKYSVLELVKVLVASFEKDPPITTTRLHGGVTSPQPNSPSPALTATPMQHQITGPPLPARPSKLSQGVDGQAERVPLKYQKPLPLPQTPPMQTATYQQAPEQPHNVEFQIPQYSHRSSLAFCSNSPSPVPESGCTTSPLQFDATKSYQQYPTSFRSPQESPQRDPFRHLSVQATAKTPPQQNISLSELSSKPKKEIGTQKDFIDLIDENTTGSGSNAVPHALVNEIEQAVATQLELDNSELASIAANGSKILAFQRQLDHHYKQAVANSKNLDSHTNYLSKQRATISTLNQNLSKLEEINLHEKHRLFVDENNAIALDALVTPDLALVNQLYDVVSDIKATKDTIDLIGGNFGTEGELISDSNLDGSVRIVRTLAREVFWLELMKTEIGSVMKLH